MSLEQSSAEHIKKFEGYVSNAMWDVNAWRIGHGSDTITSPDGTFRKVVQSDTTTKEMAKNDLARRLKIEFIPKVANKIGEPYWGKLPQGSQVALVSLAYNYGSITKQEIIDAARSGDLTKLSKAIVDSTYNDNKKLPENVRNALRKRRAGEASMVLDSIKDVIKGVAGTVKRNKIKAAVLILFLGFSVIGLILYFKNKNKKNSK